MYSPDDIARSIRRYLAEALGAPWAISLEREEIRDDQRPAGLIEMGMERQRRARASIPQGDVEMFVAVTVTLYPAVEKKVGEAVVPVTPREAGLAARLLNHLLLELVISGLNILFEDGRRASGPERWPLWDYGPPWELGEPGPEFPHDVLWVEDYSVRPIQDPLDASRWSVVLEMRVSWERPGRVSEVEELVVQSLPPTNASTP